jgi:molecular chaperone DnaJ
VDVGSRIRLRSEGEPGDDGASPGDLYIHIDVESHDTFERDGNDILIKLDVNVARAALGATTKVQTVDGLKELEIPAGTQSGQAFRMRDLGVPRLGSSGRRGDQIVIVNVAIPRKLDERQRELLEELAATMGDDISPGLEEDGWLGKVKDFMTGDGN